MRAGEIRSLARRAGIGPGVSVLDLCCGVAGPGRFVTAELGCSYLGVDLDASAIELARDRARATGLSCRFEVGEVPPVPSGPFDVVLLLETMLAFPDKETLLREVSAALVPGGRFAFTVEEGQPLTEAEREAMPAADTVWPIPLTELVGRLSSVGLEVALDPGVHPLAPAGRRRPDRTPSWPSGPPSRPSSATAPSTTCWPRTGSGATGWRRAGSASSRSSRSRPTVSARQGERRRGWLRSSR